MKQSILEKLQQLDKETAHLYELADGLNEDDLHNQAYGWSIIRVYDHLKFAEQGTIGYMKKKMQAGDGMPNFSFNGRLRFGLTKALLQSSLKWKAPKVIANPEKDLTLDEIKAEWAKARKYTRKFIEEYPDELLNKAVFKHPFAGRLDLSRAVDSIIYHQRHHMHQIKRIRKEIGR